MSIDCHAHWIPPAVAERLRSRRAVPRVEAAPDGEMFVTWQGRRPLGPLVDIGSRLALLDGGRQAMQVLSLAGLFGIDCLPIEESLPLVSDFNDGVAYVQSCHPQRFAAIAALPLADIALACAELERSHSLGLRGAILPADGFASIESAERFRPLFVIGNRLHSHFFIHPGPVEQQPERLVRGTAPDNAWQRRIVLQAQSRLSEVVVTLELSDFLQPFPNVTVQVANLGGAIPFLIERMDAVHRDLASDGVPPSRRMGRCYVDTASFGPRAVEMAVACFGADRVLFGSDCPIFDTHAMLESLAQARLDAETRELLLDGNARRIFFEGRA